MLDAGSDGERVVALAVAQDRPDPKLFDEICEAIQASRSAFEQYQALAAAFETLPEVGQSQRRKLADVLQRALDDPDRGVREDTSRARLVEALLADLSGSG